VTQLAQSLGVLSQRYRKIGIVAMLLLRAYLGLRASPRWLMLLVAGAAGIALVWEPRLGLLGLIAASLLVHLEIRTGTAVTLNAATLLVPLLFGLWLLETLRKRKFRWTASRVNRPLMLFLLAGLLSLVVGNGTWDPAIPKSHSFWLVQLAQWAIFVLAAAAFWLLAHLQEAKTWLPRLTWVFSGLSGGVILLLRLPGVGPLLWPFTTVTIQQLADIEGTMMDAGNLASDFASSAGVPSLTPIGKTV